MLVHGHLELSPRARSASPARASAVLVTLPHVCLRCLPTHAGQFGSTTGPDAALLHAPLLKLKELSGALHRSLDKNVGHMQGYLAQEKLARYERVFNGHFDLVQGRFTAIMQELGHPSKTAAKTFAETFLYLLDNLEAPLDLPGPWSVDPGPRTVVRFLNDRCSVTASTIFWRGRSPNRPGTSSLNAKGALGWLWG